MDDDDWFDDLPDSALLSVPDPQNAQNAQNVQNAQAAARATAPPAAVRTCAPSAAQPSPDVLQRIQRNKDAALAKRAAAQGNQALAAPVASAAPASASPLPALEGALVREEQRLRMQRNREAALAKLASKKRKSPPRAAAPTAAAAESAAAAKRQHAVHHVDDVDIDAMLEDEDAIARERDLMQAAPPPPPEYDDTPAVASVNSQGQLVLGAAPTPGKPIAAASTGTARAAGAATAASATAVPFFESRTAASPLLPAPPVPHGRSLEDTLQANFGFQEFREGQREVVEAVLGGRDVAVFWATGRGKSLTYQLPALHTGRVAVVVSPLISLMNDQCKKLNATAGEGKHELATFLGSGQTDPHAEARAFGGRVRIIYLTPERLASGACIEQLARLHQRTGLSVIAIDEAHCVSSWGHDFRKEYRLVHTVREHAALRDVPLVALTATAVPNVQHDICQQLRLRPGFLRVTQSFDRPNLEIVVNTKPMGEGGYSKALLPLVEELTRRPRDNSTIVYAPTKRDVDLVAAFLAGRLRQANSGAGVAPYHAGLSHAERQSAHTGFLTGAIQVIVATVAFGMGIDKPDTRRVLHWGAPKTVEEYYQQIGRAGRDGRPARCEMFANPSDFSRYDCDFYLKDLGEEAKRATRQSMAALRAFATDTCKCRRAALLEFFNERPPFGDRCGTCDNCVNNVKYAGDMERDFGAEGRVVLAAVSGLREQSLSYIEKVLAGGILKEDWRYRPDQNKRALANRVLALRKKVQRKRDSTPFYKSLVATLVQAKHLAMDAKASAHGSYDVYFITPKGSEALRQTGAPLMLRVPPSIRQYEEEQQQQRDQRVKKLQAEGIDVAAIPQDELDTGSGAVLGAHRQWVQRLKKRREEGSAAPGGAGEKPLLQLLQRIETWRDAQSQHDGVAPAAVMSEHVMRKVAYTAERNSLDIQGLRDAGVRSAGAKALAATIAAWRTEFRIIDAAPIDLGGGGIAIALPDSFTPTQPWAYATYKPNRKTGRAVWENSYDAFVAGKSINAIAMTGNVSTGKALAPSTVVSHVLSALVLGKTVPLKRLFASTPADIPTMQQWEQLADAERSTGQDPTSDPARTSWRMTDMLRPIVGDDIADTMATERTEAQKAVLAPWWPRVRVYAALRKAGFTPAQ